MKGIKLTIHMFGGVFEELQRADGVLDGHEEERRFGLRLDEVRHQLVLVDFRIGLKFDLALRHNNRCFLSAYVLN